MLSVARPQTRMMLLDEEQIMSWLSSQLPTLVLSSYGSPKNLPLTLTSKYDLLVVYLVNAGVPSYP